MARGSRDNPLTAAELLDEDLRPGPPHPPYYITDDDGDIISVHLYRGSCALGGSYKSPKGHAVDYNGRFFGRRYWQVTGTVPGGLWRSKFSDARLMFFIHLSEEDVDALRRLEAKLGCTETCVRTAYDAAGALLCVRDEGYAPAKDEHGRDAEIVKGSRVTLHLELNGLRAKADSESLMYRVCGVVVH
jgi:hypothetical protein